VKKVVVTGIGLLTPLGCGKEDNWRAIQAGQSGIRPITHMTVDNIRAKVCGRLWDFDGSEHFDAKTLRRFDPFIHYGVVACRQALADANLCKDAITEHDPYRVGVAMGSGIGGIQNMEQQHSVAVEQNPGRISPFFVTGTIINMVSGMVAIEYNCKGPNLALVSACASGAHNIILAAQCIQNNQADVMIAGASEYASNLLGLGGFSAMRAVSANTDAAKASRPWDKDRDGFVLSDGAAALVLESEQHAKARGATIYAELAGYGMSADAYHINQPDPEGKSAQMCMQLAINSAKIEPKAIDYVNAHATSTPLGDQVEPQLLKNIAGSYAKNIPISSTKSMHGHMLGAAGACEAAISILALKHQYLPPTINLDEPSTAPDMDYVAHRGRKASIAYALSNSFGFGGTNACLLFKHS